MFQITCPYLHNYKITQSSADYMQKTYNSFADYVEKFLQTMVDTYLFDKQQQNLLALQSLPRGYVTMYSNLHSWKGMKFTVYRLKDMFDAFGVSYST